MSSKLILKAKWAHASEYASLSSDGKLSLDGIFEEVLAPEVPAALPRFFVSAAFDGTPKSSHKLSLRIVPPYEDKNSLIEAPKEVVLGENGKLNLLLGVGGYVFKKFGNYKLEIIENNLILTSVQLSIKKQQFN
jgi:hypothetical protein